MLLCCLGRGFTVFQRREGVYRFRERKDDNLVVPSL
jgi:hypothetical protein